MSSRNSSSSSTRALLLALVALIGITTFTYRSRTSNSSTPHPNTSMSSSTATPADLALSIAQTSANPPTLSIKLTNTHASAPLTLLTWDSPLDPQALALGLVHIAPAASEGDEPFKLPTIKVSRKLPPRREDLITLAPGQSRAQEIEFKEPVVPLGKIREKGGKAKVWVMGNWRALWAKTVEQVGDEELEAMEAAKDGMTGAFESEGVLVEV